jgi:ribosome recycling factor
MAFLGLHFLNPLTKAEKEGGMGKDEVVRLKAEVQKYIDEGNDALMKSLEKKEMEISQ